MLLLDQSLKLDDLVLAFLELLLVLEPDGLNLLFVVLPLVLEGFD